MPAVNSRIFLNLIFLQKQLRTRIACLVHRFNHTVHGSQLYL
jgi:hypothetical protein